MAELRSRFILDPDAPFRLVTTDDYLHPDLPAIARTETRPWLLARPWGDAVWIGPLFRPDSSPCWFCLAHWIETTRPFESARKGDALYPYVPALHMPLERQAAHWIAEAVHQTTLDGTVLVIGASGAPLRVKVPVAPGCRCGPPKPPSNPLDWVNPVCGLIPNMELSQLPVGGRYLAHAQFFAPLPRPGSRGHLEPDDAWGGGWTEDEAIQSCIFEALERYSEIWQGAEPEDIAPMARVANALSPAEILLFSERQYETREPSEPDGFHWIPNRFDPTAPCAWTEVKEALSGETARVPASMCYLWRTYDRSAFAVADSNGCAAGVTPEDAQYRALLELIERDAVAVWWYNRIPRLAIPWSTLGDERVDLSIEELNRQAIRPALLDLTHDLGIPVLAAVAFDGEETKPFFGAAADPDPRRAAERALNELIQFRSWLPWAPQDVPTPEYLRAHGACALPAAAYDSGSFPALARRLERHGIRVYTLDLTRPEIGVPVYRVFAPGLRHAWRRLAPGRLYDVPVRLGWLRTVRREEDLNPVGCPL